MAGQLLTVQPSSSPKKAQMYLRLCGS